jgi:hypothetical protein
VRPRHATDAPPAPTRHLNVMSSSERPQPPTTSTTELIVVTADRYRVEGDVKDVERIILDAARGSIMQLAWLIEAETRNDLAVNPEHVVVLRAAGS